MAYTWIPFYNELSQKLLQFKDNRKPLVDFIYSDLSTVGSKSLVDYIHMEDGSKVKDIDPFSVFAIFNRHLRPENKNGFLQKFKDKFGIKSDIPTDFDGIPTVNSQRAFFFNLAALVYKAYDSISTPITPNSAHFFHIFGSLS